MTVPAREAAADQRRAPDRPPPLPAPRWPRALTGLRRESVNAQPATAPRDGVRTLRRDPRHIERLLHLTGPMQRRLFRPEVRGLDRLGAGPCLLVANHSIGAPWEVLALLDAWVRTFGSSRPVFGLAHEFSLRLPLLRSQLRRVGAVPATYEAAHQVLASGASLIVFPGGNLEAARPFWRRDRCDLGGHRGWARIALRAGVPVVPLAIVGSHAINPVLAPSETLAWISLARPLFRIRSLPVSLGQILVGGVVLGGAAAVLPLWLAALVAFVAFTSPGAVFFPLLPSRIVAEAGTPVDLRAALGPGLDEEAAAAAAYRLVSGRIQAGMDALVAERRGILG
jgi:1-acyl-sn-glycerol-3-phosphate acyltransferase